MGRSARALLLATWSVWSVWLVGVTLGYDGRFYDELLWTKSNWNEYVLAFPYKDVLGKLDPSTGAFLSSIVDVEALKGISEQATVDFEVRATALPEDPTALSPSDKRAFTELVACDAQTALVEVLWPVVANWTLVHAARLDDEQLFGLVEEACSIDVPVVVLKDEALAVITVEKEKFVDVESRADRGDKIQQAIKVQALDRSLYAVSMSRRSQHSSVGEISVVTDGCMEVADDAWRQAMLRAQAMYLDVVRGAVRQQDGRSDQGGKGRGEVGADFGIEINRSCCDYHPQCQFWARKGECSANPKYMVGTEETGQCRLACGVCQVGAFYSCGSFCGSFWTDVVARGWRHGATHTPLFRWRDDWVPVSLPYVWSMDSCAMFDDILQAPEMESIPAHLSASAAQMVEDGFTDTLLFLLEGADRCEEGQNHLEKELEALLRSHKSTHARSIADHMHKVVLLDGGVGRENRATSASEELAATFSPQIQVWVSNFEDATIDLKHVSGKVESDGTSGRMSLVDGREADTMGNLVKSHLDTILHDRCVHIDLGTFWMYQFCYGNSLIQFHQEKNSPLVIQLGRFLETASAWEVVNDGAEKAIVHEYSKDGDECAETGENRRALVRYLCDPSLSSGAGIRVEIRETRLCEYELKVYLRDLCEIM